MPAHPRAQLPIRAPASLSAPAPQHRYTQIRCVTTSWRARPLLASCARKTPTRRRGRLCGNVVARPARPSLEMPRPAQPGQRYVPGLDGIRALAVLSVIAYHLNFSWAQGGMLGVGVFFTLSGYLITDLLLGHWHRHGDLGLGQFWLRRARRLLPALFLMLVVVSVWVALLHAGELAAVRRQVVAAALYFSNWSTIALHGSYFSRFAAPLPLDHLWSLSIEEQFYLVWPWVLLVAIYFLRSRGGLLMVTLAGTVISAVIMGNLFHPGNLDPTRVYEGTDTRAFELLIGAALAVVRPTTFPRFGS